MKIYADIRAIEAQMTNVVNNIVSKHYVAGGAWLFFRFCKAIFGLYIMLQIVMQLSPMWNG